MRMFGNISYQILLELCIKSTLKFREKRDEIKEGIDDILMKSFLESTLLRTYVS